MKKALLLLLPALILSACCKDHSDIIPGQNFIPADILEEIEINGHIIYDGFNPPPLSGKYLMSPSVLVNSNFDDPYLPGHLFVDAEIEFYDYDPDKLTIKVRVTEGTVIGEGKGSFISGEGDNFTVYVRLDLKDASDHEFLQADVFSGTLEAAGIRDLQRSVFMIDDGGDPNDEYIENGNGRLAKDGDGFSEKI